MPFYEPRNVEIRFNGRSRNPTIRVDGPSSPHRYDNNGALCIWYPHDPPESRWVFDDGLLALLNHIQGHLFREAWWRETGEWLGPEAPHVPRKELVKDETDDRDHTDLRRPSRR